jgi:aminoglycoside 3-N-acetyltransferase I
VSAAPFSIRALGPADVELMRGLLRTLGEVFGAPGTYTAAEPSDAYLERLLGSECFIAVVAAADGEVVGGLTAYELRKPEQERSEVYIYDLAVAEPYRRRGIATASIEETRRIAKERGAWVVIVQADLGDDPAIALYSKLGKREDVLNFDIEP